MTQWIITSSILIAVIAAARFLLRGKISLRLQYALWGLVLLRLLVPVSIGSTGMSVMNVVEGTAVDATSRTSAVVGYIGGETPDLSVVEPDTNASPEEQAAQYETNRQAWQTEMDAARAETGTPITVSGILKLIWLSGAAVMASWLLASNLRFSARLRRSRRALDVNDCSLPVYVSALIDTPCLFGLFRPSVYVTPAVADNETVLRHSIEHETTHFRHGDHIWVVLRGVCLALHWYNPLVWLAAALSRRDAELACDEATIKRMGESERMEYGRTLIGLTCQKRTALLLTATTMTGSKRGIKERITLIAKKPKMAIYTLIAVVLIAALAVGCTFTGAKRSLTGEPVFTRLDEVSSITLGALPNDMRMVDEEHFDEMLEWISAFTLGEKQMGDAAPGSNSYSITLAYSGDESESSGLDIVVRDGTAYYVERPDFPDGWYEIWGAADDSSVVVDAEIDAPSAVIDYAADYVQQIVDSWNEGILTDAENGLSFQHTSKLTEARIVGLTQISTGTAGLNDGLALYLLEYRLLPEDPDIIGLAGGMQMEVIDGEQWLTEWGSVGQPYLLLHYDDSGKDTVWQRICVTNTITMQEEYATPEMLEQYRDMYTAAAMELYTRHQSIYTINGVTMVLEPGFTIREDGYRCFVNEDGVMAGAEILTKDDERLMDYTPAYDTPFDLPQDDYGSYYFDHVFEAEYHYYAFRLLTRSPDSDLIRIELMCPEYLMDKYAEIFPLWASTAYSNADVSVSNIESLIIDMLNSDGAYAEAAQYALIDNLINEPAETLEAIGARPDGIRDWLCWTVATGIKGMALDTRDALSGDGLSEDGQYACELIISYFSENTAAPKSWRQIYLEFWDEKVPTLSEDEIIAVGLFDLQSDGVPELAVWYQNSSDGILYYTDGVSSYHNLGNIYEGMPPDEPGSVLSVQTSGTLDHNSMNAFLNSWRP